MQKFKNASSKRPKKPQPLEMAESGGDKSLTSLSDRDLLQALNLTDAEENITVGALLLFGKE